MNNTTFVGLPIGGWFQCGILRGMKGIAFQKTGSETYQEMHYSFAINQWVKSGDEKTWFNQENNQIFRFDSNVISEQC